MRQSPNKHKQQPRTNAHTQRTQNNNFFYTKYIKTGLQKNLYTVTSTIIFHEI